jgi:cytochrome c biogenesis protein CcmG, thiol:disulfide interchange protein DsbE
MKRTILLILAVLALTACTGAQPTLTSDEFDAGDALIATESRLLDRGRGAPAVGDLAPDFSFTLNDGTTTRLSELRGTPVLINFWATWCLPCIEEMPAIEQVYREAEGGLAVLAVNRNELPAAIARFAPTVDVSFPLISDLGGEIGDRYTVTSLPTTYFIASDGTIHGRHIGALSLQQLTAQMEALP